MKKIIKTIIFLFLFTSAYAQDRRILDVNMLYQEKSNWCWDASSQMILDYYNISLTQCEIAEIARVIDERNYHIHYPNSTSPNHFGTLNCCSTNNYCNKANGLYTTVLSAPGSKGGVNTILDSLNIANSKINSYLSLSNVKNEINSWNPFIIRWGWYGTNQGHAVVCKGYDGNYLYINDPDILDNHPGGSSIKNYDWVVENAGEIYHHQWTSTLVLDTQPSCGHSMSWFTQPITTNISCSETDYIEISSSISNNTNVNISFGKECLLNIGFEIATGSSLSIMPNSTLNCN